MKGRWKQKLKHLIKDNRKVILKRQDNLPKHVFKEERFEKKIKRKEIKKNKNEYLIPFYKLVLFNKEKRLGSTMAYKIKEGYKTKYIEIGNTLLDKYKGCDIIENEVGVIKNPNYEKENLKGNEEIFLCIWNKNTKQFFYNKLIYVLNLSRVDKKSWKKIGNRIRRARERESLNKYNYKEEVPMHKIEKSFRWFLD